MKKYFLILILLVITFTMLAFFSYNTQILAVSGCCKIRDSHLENWQKTDQSFESCKESNEKSDRDNVFDASGLVWWDVTCR